MVAGWHEGGMTKVVPNAASTMTFKFLNILKNIIQCKNIY
jgi:hypothetical protein